MPLQSRPLLIAVTVAALAGAALAGCGKRGSLDAPQAVTGTPSPPTATADSGQGKKEGDAAKPHQPTILDGLLR